MVRVCFISFTLLIGLNIFGQNIFIRQGTLKASATISPSKMLNRSVQNIYISGFLGYQLEQNLSLRGDTYFYIKGAGNKPTDLSYGGALNTYFGAFYHKNKRNWDNYIGFQPGLAVIKTNYLNKSSFCPSFAAKIGTAFYVWKYFHFFADLTYTKTAIRNTTVSTIKADELIFSAGLGFQINTKKEDKQLHPISIPNF